MCGAPVCVCVCVCARVRARAAGTMRGVCRQVKRTSKGFQCSGVKHGILTLCQPCLALLPGRGEGDGRSPERSARARPPNSHRTKSPLPCPSTTLPGPSRCILPSITHSLRAATLVFLGEPCGSRAAQSSASDLQKNSHFAITCKKKKRKKKGLLLDPASLSKQHWGWEQPAETGTRQRQSYVPGGSSGTHISPEVSTPPSMHRIIMELL